MVGKGAPDGEPIIALDTLLEADRERRGRRAEVRRRRSLARRSAYLDRQRSQGRRQARGRSHPRAIGLKVGSFVAPIWGGAGGGSAMGDADDAQAVPQRRSAEGLPDRPSRCARSASARPAASASTRSTRRRGLGQGPGRQHQEDRRDVPRGRQDRAGPRRVSWSPRARSAGAACSQLAREREAARRWSACRASSATRPTWRTRCCFMLGANAEEDRILPEGLRLEGHGRARRRLQEGGRRAAALDARLPRRAERRHRCSAPATHEKTGRHCRPTDPNGKLDITKHAGYWLRDDKRQADQDDAPHLLGRLHVPQRGDGERRQTWNDDPRRRC